jgi:hypothetical protein
MSDSNFETLPLETRVKILWDRGWSRNTISQALHIGHAKTQKIIRELDRTVHESKKRFRLQRYRAKYNELVEYEGLPRKGTLHKISERSKLGLRAKTDPEALQEFLQGERIFSP